MNRREFLTVGSTAALVGGFIGSQSSANTPTRLASRRVWCWAGTDKLMEGFFRKRGEVMPKSLICPAADWVDFFHCRNVDYQPMEDHYTADKFKGLEKFDGVSVHLDAGASRKLAKELSQASLQCPNLVGGFYDDFSSSVKEGKVTVQGVEGLAASLKSVNPHLKLNAVCYTKHLALDLSPFLPYFDSVSLWTWKAADLKDLDAHVAKAIRLYRKPLQLGLYLFPWGDLHVDKDDPHYWAHTLDTVAMPMETLQFQCERARQYLKDGRIEAIHILGSYATGELKTAQARWLANFCLSV